MPRKLKSLDNDTGAVRVWEEVPLQLYIPPTAEEHKEQPYVYGIKSGHVSMLPFALRLNEKRVKGVPLSSNGICTFNPGEYVYEMKIERIVLHVVL